MSAVFFFFLLIVGINFKVTLGEVSWLNGRVAYIATTRTEARIVSIARDIAISIPTVGMRCIAPSYTSRDFRPNVPILFELCHASKEDVETIIKTIDSRYEKSHLILTLNTAEWLRLSLLKL